jgi:hypothetical protein
MKGPGTGSVAAVTPAAGAEDFASDYVAAFRKLLVSKNNPGFLRFLYMHNPMEAGDTRLSGSGDYYIFQEDKRALALLLQTHAGAFAETRAIVDLGPGDVTAVAEKVVPFLRLPMVARYCAVDSNPRVFEPLESAMRTMAPGVAFEAYRSEFLENPASIPSVPHALYLMLGNTIGDLPAYSAGRSARGTLVRYLGRLRARIPPASHLVLGIDTASDPGKFLRAYQSDLTTFFLQRGLDWLAARDPELAPACSALRPEVGFDEGANSVVLGYRAGASVEGRHRLAKGDLLVAGVSYRFSAEVFAASLETAGFAVHDSISAPGDTVRLFVAA